MKRVLITGADGFIGRHCIPLLKHRGFEIYALFFKEQRFFSKDAHWIDHNLLNSSPQNLLEQVNPTHLLHLAWNVTPGKFWNSLDNLAWVKSSIDLFEAFALQGGKRVVGAGTCAEYDWEAKKFCEQTTPCHPKTLYGVSKYTLSLILNALSKQMGFTHAWGRIFYLYGRHEYSERLIPLVIQKILKKESIPCSHGNQIKDFMHVEDVANAFVSLLDSDLQGDVNIASGKGISVKQVIENIAELLQGHEYIQFGVLPPQNEPDQLVAVTRRLQDELHWVPSISLEQGLRDSIEWWKERVLQ